MNERCHTNSVPWMYAIGLNKSGFTESTNCVHSWYGVSVTAVIHGTELMWPRSFMVRSWCDREHSWYGVGVIPQSHSTWFLCTLYSGNSFGGFFPFCVSSMTKKSTKFHTKSTLRSWCNLAKWPYGVKKISIKWLWPVKVTLKVVKRRLKDFCWSCEEGPLNKKKKNIWASKWSVNAFYCPIINRLEGFRIHVLFKQFNNLGKTQRIASYLSPFFKYFH